MSDLTSVLALDIGTKRTGVAKANSVARIAGPLVAIHDSEGLPSRIAELAIEHNAIALVIGLPRSLSGENTAQTEYVQKIAATIKQQVDVPVYFIDEAVTSAHAEAELKARKKLYIKEDIDMLSAVYILEDFLREYPEVL